MVGEFITFLHRNVRVVAPAILVMGAAAVFGLAHILNGR